MKRIAGILFGLIAAAVTAFAQTSIKVEVPNVVAADEQFNLTFIIEDGSPSDFSWDAGDDFQVVWGPQRGTSSYTSIVNGKRSHTSQYTYTYVLMPRKTGTFTIPQASATVKGKTITSPASTSIQVVSDGASSSQGGSSSRSSGSSGSQSGSSSGAASTGSISSEDLFLRFSLSRTSVVTGQPVTASLKLYQRVNIAGFEDVKFPTFDGFWSQETYAPSNVEFQRESVGDKIYNTAVLRTWTLIPQQSGSIKIDPAEIVCLVNVRTGSTPRSILDSFFQSDYTTIRKRVTSDPCTIHVSNLPAGAPASFGGGVGTFSIKAKVSKDSLKTHDAASLLVTVSGKGNVSLLEAPKVSFPPDFEQYDVKMTDNVDKSSGGLSGSKTFEFPFIPRSGGDFTIEPVEYSYYDTNSGKYVTLHTDPIQIKVEKSNASESQGSTLESAPAGTLRKDVKTLGEDIRYIATGHPKLSSHGKLFFGSAIFIVLLCLIIAGAAAAYFLLRFSQARRADVAGTRKRGASKMARKRLTRAGAYLKEGLYTAFYEELHKALLGFISDKLSINLSDMSKETIQETLVSEGVSVELADSFNQLLDACEYARYSPDSGHEAMNAHYETALNVISSIDGSLKTRKSGAGAGTATLALAAILMLSPLAADAANDYPDSLWTAGVEAYSAGQWSDAEADWTAVAGLGINSPELEYNLGNVYFKLADYARATLHYERALKLDPSYGDARFNLELTQGFIQDKIDSVPEFFLKQWSRKLSYSMSCDAWAVCFLLLLAIALGLAVVFLLSRVSGARKASFFGGIAALVLSLCCLGFALSQKADRARNDSAIILKPVTSVKSSPGSETSKDLFVLHEGTKVRILDRIGDWQNIELSDGRQGWLHASDMEVI